MPFFDSDGVRLHYELAGPDDGVPTLLLHGFASHYALNWVGTRWQDTLTKAGRLVIGLDQRGHGHSDKPHDPRAYAHGVMGADAARLLGHLGVGEADVIGYSMGSRVALGAAANGALPGGRLVLGGLGTLGGFTRADAIARRLRGDESVHDPVAESFYSFASTRAGNDLEALAACILGEPADLSEASLSGVQRPTLVVIGELDDLVEGGRDLARRLPRATYLEIPGRDHLSTVTAAEFKRAALAFLEEA